MKTWLLLIAIGFFGCTPKEKAAVQSSHDQTVVQEPDPWEVVKPSQDYIDFQVFINRYPESVHFEEALKRLFELREKEWAENPPPPHCFPFPSAGVFVNFSGNILFEKHPSITDSIRKQAFAEMFKKEYDQRTIHLPVPGAEEKKKVSYSRCYFEFRFDEDTYDYLQPVVIEVSKGIREYQNHLAREWNGRELPELNDQELETIVSLFDHCMTFPMAIPPPPPPPPDFLKNNEGEL